MIGITATSTEVKTKIDIESLLAELKALSKNHVLVGVPSDKADRPTITYKKGSVQVKLDKITNAQLAYIHDRGSPKMNIPARPFMKPGIAKAQDQINREFKAAAMAKLDGKEGQVQEKLHRAGLVAQNSIRNVIRRGEGFVPLKRGTLLARTRKRAYAWYSISRAEMVGASKAQKAAMRGAKREAIMGSFKPLMDTNQMLKSIIYIVEEKGEFYTSKSFKTISEQVFTKVGA